MALLLSVVFFLSGAAALIFESLWLRRAGLMLGNGVWASSVVLASFMAGLAAGNALATRLSGRLRRPLRFYALLELAAGAAGLLVVLAMPWLTPILVPLFRALGEAPGLTNLLRLVVAFLLMLLPTTAMGLTLPVLTHALSRADHDFGRVLGRLYGWNTLGGVLGAAMGELWLVGRLGLRGTACFAAGLNLLAAGLAGWLARRGPAEVSVVQSASLPRLNLRAWRLLGGAFLAGASLLALEVVWFRFLQLFLFGTTLTFAFMLAVILFGVGVGGLCASAWLRRNPAAHLWLPAAAGAAGLATTLAYAIFSPEYSGATFFISQADGTLVLSLRLMLATSLISGVIFTLQGAALRYELPAAGETTGLLTLANTLGAMLGALGAGFVLLPWLGMEGSLLAVVILYGGVAALSAPSPRLGSARKAQWVWVASLAAVAAAGMAFPTGAMVTRYLPTSLSRYMQPGVRALVVREGVLQTTTYLRTEWGGKPVSHRLVTNGHSMSGSNLAASRYMKMYVYWAKALHPQVKQALLISYGLGSTAKALTDTRELTSIDIVDIARDILELGAITFPPGANPLLDPRVRVHVEDGRFFLQTTAHSFDLITGEPPPLKAAGIVSLYSREYFQLLYQRLNQNGVATYWLPVEELEEDDARGVVRAFCDVFQDCSLWTGAGTNWMLAGSRGASAPISEEEFTAQWRDPVVGPELVRLAIERPEQLGATFLADAEQLASWIAQSPPLVDDYPQRMSPRYSDPARQGYIERWMDTKQAAARFRDSRFVKQRWPRALRERTQAFFAAQGIVNQLTVLPSRPVGIDHLRGLLVDSTLYTLPLLAAGSIPVIQDIARRSWDDGVRSPELDEQLAIGAMAARDYAEAAARFARLANTDGPRRAHFGVQQAFTLVLAGRPDEARVILTGLPTADAMDPRDREQAQEIVRWLAKAMP